MSANNIMIVEDNPINMKLAHDALEMHGYKVCCSMNANEALEKMPSFIPEVILMDIQLPDIDGLKLTRQIKDNPTYSNVIIIAITASAMKGDREKALAAGCDDYVAKPANIFDVINLIEQKLAAKNVG